MSRSLTLALDLGSSSVRGMVCDENAHPMPGRIARRSIHPAQGDDGSGELDAAGYVSSLVACLDELDGNGALDGVAQVATSAQWHSVLPVDLGSGAPIGSALTWLDTRAPVRREPADPDAFHRRTGSWVHPLYWTAKIGWLREDFPRIARLPMDRLRFIGLPDHARHVLLEDDATSLSLAAGSGMLDLATGEWDAEALDIAGVAAEALPRIEEKPGRLAVRWRDRWPDLAEVPWHPAIGDGAASNLGSGCGAADRVAVTVGTSVALRVVHTEPSALPWEVWRYRVDADRYVSGIAFSGGGVLYAATMHLLGRGKDSAREPSVPPGRSGLTVLPWHAGSRPPGTIPAGCGAVVGLGLDTTGTELLAGTLDGVSMATADALDTLEAMLGRRLEVVLGGGAIAASRWWARSFAAAYDRTVLICPDGEVGAIGATAAALGIVPEPPGETIEPDPADVAAMRTARRRFDRAREAVGGVLVDDQAGDQGV